MESKFELEKRAKNLLDSNPKEACELYRKVWSEFSDSINEWDAFFTIKALRAAKDYDLNWARNVAEKFEDDKSRGLYAWLVFDACVKGKNEGDIVRSDSIISALPEISPQRNQQEESPFPCPTTICLFKLIAAHKKNNFKFLKEGEL